MLYNIAIWSTYTFFPFQSIIPDPTPQYLYAMFFIQ